MFHTASVGMSAGGMVHTVSVGVGAVQVEWNGQYSNSECACSRDGLVGLVFLNIFNWRREPVSPYPLPLYLLLLQESL